MGVWVSSTVEVKKGDVKEVEAFLMQHPHLKGYPEPMETGVNQDGVPWVMFDVKNWTPDAIFDDLAARFPDYEFTVTRVYDAGGDCYRLYFAGGKFVRSAWLYVPLPPQYEFAEEDDDGFNAAYVIAWEQERERE